MRGFGEAALGGERVGLGEQRARRAGFGLSAMVVGIRVAAPAAKAQIVDPLRKGGDEMVEKRSEVHTSELQSLVRISYAVFCLTNKTSKITKAHFTTPISNSHHVYTLLHQTPHKRSR